MSRLQAQLHSEEQQALTRILTQMGFRFPEFEEWEEGCISVGPDEVLTSTGEEHGFFVGRRAYTYRESTDGLLRWEVEIYDKATEETSYYEAYEALKQWENS
jgi:hypothetical protein